ncbi:hypothetical protein [Symbioplanes lichenis]|uniref:hypothetical protein n=1 Tax=Symbioplanes lichenis TaxID=1629072 RepID=UPI0027395CCD|nr:hypothetical protein [Actinoplanes lichenis]
MSFSVDPAALDAYAAQLGRARGDAEQCQAHFDAYVPELAPTDGFLNLLTYEHSRVRAALQATLEQLTSVLGSSRDEVAAAATGYGQTDAQRAAGLDSTYPQVTRAAPDRD